MRTIKVYDPKRRYFGHITGVRDTHNVEVTYIKGKGVEVFCIAKECGVCGDEKRGLKILKVI